jgi:hypothetical protein
VKQTRIRRSVVALAMGVLLACGQLGTSASAATKAPAAPVDPSKNNANSLKLSPLRSDLTLDPGTSGTVKVNVTNITKAAIVLKAIENDFVAGDEKGTPSLILDQNSYAPSHSLKRFMSPIANVTVAPGSTQEVSVKIDVPKKAQAGGYYGALRFAPAGSGDQALALSSGIASIILLKVSGPTVERLTLTNFDIQQNGGTGSNFRTPDDLGILIRFKNEGNVHEAPFGQINVQKGKKVVYSYDFNAKDPKDTVLPDSARRWQVPLKNIGKFGKYTVSATFGYGSKGDTINIEKSVWIIPSTVIMAIVIAVVVVAGIILGLWVFLRNYKRRILKSSRRRY